MAGHYFCPPFYGPSIQIMPERFIRLCCCLFLCGTGNALSAQAPEPVAFYPFEQGSLEDSTGNMANDATAFNVFDLACGLSGDALAFDGSDQFVIASTTILDLFTTFDFSISFYFKPVGGLSQGAQTILHKRNDCQADSAFYVTYRPNSNTLTAVLSQNASLIAPLVGELDANACWQHVAIVRNGRTARLYLNGELVDERTTTLRLDLTNTLGAFVVGSSGCSATENNFRGHLEDLRIYDQPLSTEDVERLFVRPDKIVTGNQFSLIRDTTIFLGESVRPVISNTCAEFFTWTPAATVADPTAKNPTITPTETTIYTVDMEDPGAGCVATDSFLVIVVDPADIDCEEVFLPKAFTPNGDGLNEIYTISNPFAIPDLISFEIFDRWGGRVFFTDDVQQGWDGTVKGEALPPGVFLYKVRYNCTGEEKIKAGSLTILR